MRVANYCASQVYEFHGASRIDNVKELEKYDVVLTTCALPSRLLRKLELKNSADAVMESSFRRENKGFQKKGVLMKEDSIIHKIKWSVRRHRSSIAASLTVLNPQLGIVSSSTRRTTSRIAGATPPRLPSR